MSSTFNLITILGPTATGKTTFAAHLANLIKAEIISADSRQVYRGMDLGTGKDIADYTIDGETIPYHLVDIVNAGEKYNVYEFQTDFLEVYNEIKKRKVLPILCGGSGMYVEAVLKGYKLLSVPVNEPLRASLYKLSLEELTVQLSEFKDQHNRTDADTKKRAIRAIEIASYYRDHSEINTSFPEINSLIFGIKLERQIVRDRITLRLKQRLRDGMIDEVQNLLNAGVSAETLAYYGLEYKFITQYLNNEFNYNTMFDRLNVAIHQFSKRQMTWFRKMERGGFKIHWIDGELEMQEKVQAALEIMHAN
ncbi:MAG: tRNA (adenosine(37)-N6)-dimethylallyltransferase MiaA [Salinivirgaceae bacterium]|jgi:tRNA dimethylallyltransferase|nr:tRNA (adenosine(37)-N6)-dimethylallyltransferase MiaA [Salinivirgaceae bacterium]